MEKQDYTIQHQKAYLFLAFAQMTDSDISQEEIDKIYTKIKQWGDVEQDQETLEQLMEEAKKWYLSNTDPRHVLDVVLEIAEDFNKQEWFNEIYKNIILYDLVAIAKADDNFDENEKQWIEELAKVWDMPVNL